jgi:hypothetical protein
VWVLRGLVIAAAATAMVGVLAGVALADDTCSPTNPGDCNNTAAIIGGIATITVVLTVAIATITQEAPGWTPFRCAQELDDLDYALDSALAKFRASVEGRNRLINWMAEHSSDPKAVDMAQGSLRLHNQYLDKFAEAIDDIYARRVAVFQGCGSKVDGAWNRPKPSVTRGEDGTVSYVEPQTAPHPPREGAGRGVRIIKQPGGGSALMSPEGLGADIKDALTGRIPPKYQGIVDKVKPQVDNVTFKPGADGSVDVSVGATVDVGGGIGALASDFTGTDIATPSMRLPQSAGVNIGVSDGKITAKITDWPKAAGAAGMSAEKAAKDLQKTLDNFNKSLSGKGLQVTGVSIQDGKLQVTTGPK